MKRIVLGTLALVMASAMVLPVGGMAMAQPELADSAQLVTQALAIKAPKEARVGQVVTITVVEKHTSRPVPRAGVLAIDINNIENEANDAEAYASLAEKCGEFLGWTDSHGNVFHRFVKPGKYVLVAVKDGFVPGFTKIMIKPTKALAIKAPEVAWVGQLVTIEVIEKHFHYPIPRAAVFAANVKDIVSQTDDTEAYAELAKTCGHFIGWTNGKGEVYHRFRQAGRYVLVAVKDGFVPGLAKIAIKPLHPVELINTAIPE